MNLPSDMLSRGAQGRRDFDLLTRAFGWTDLVEIHVPNAECDEYYEDLRILYEPVSIPKWTNLVPKRKSKLLNPEVLKLWPDLKKWVH